MELNESEHIGLCTICQTVHISEQGFNENHVCENCGEPAVQSINTLSDIANDYKRLKEEYNKLVEEGVGLGDYD